MLKAPVRSLLPGTVTIFYAADVVNMQTLVFEGGYRDRLNRTGMLPAGNYQIIVHLDSVSLPVAVSNTQTKPFYLSATQLPVLISPAQGELLPGSIAQTAITFRWTPVSPRPVEPVHYHVQVFEVLPGQTAVRALRSNQPLLDQDVVGTTQFVWRPMLSFIDGTVNRFVWTIQSFDSKNNIIAGEVSNGEGRSEVKTFNVGTAPATAKGHQTWSRDCECWVMADQKADKK